MLKNFKINKMDLFVAVYIFAVVAMEVMGAKTVLFPWIQFMGKPISPTVAILLLPLVYSANDVIIEVFGKERMKQIIRVSLIIIVLIILTSALFTWLPPSARFAETESAYDTIFHIGIRMSIASLLAFGFAEFMDVYVFSKLREKMGNTKLWLRTNLSNIISEFIDTFVFMALAFYVLDMSFSDNLSFIVRVGIPYWIAKCFMSIICTPLVYAGVKWFRKSEEIKV